MDPCSNCGSRETEAVAHLGSYILRCRACGTNLVATSLSVLAGVASDRFIEAWLDPRADSADAALAAEIMLGMSQPIVSTPLVQGPVPDAFPMISRLAAAGVHLVLRLSTRT